MKENTRVSDEQLDTAVEEADLPELAACFDNTEDYVEKLQLSPGQQTDVRTQTFVNGTQAGMKVALKYWRNRNPVEATFRALLLILLSLLKGNVTVRVCQYLLDKRELNIGMHSPFRITKYYPPVTVSGEVVRLKPSHKRPSEPGELGHKLKGCGTMIFPKQLGDIDITDNYGQDDIKIIQEVFLDGTRDEDFFPTEQTKIVYINKCDGAASRFTV